MLRTVVLSADEFVYCEQLGIRRTQNNRAHNVRRDVRGSKSNVDYDIFGTLGEFAFCKLFGAPFDDSIFVRSGGEDTVLGSVTIDVKSTDLMNGRLLANKSSVDHPVDVYTLMISQDWYTWRFAGWAAREELLRPENIMRMSQNYPQVYALQQRSLHSPDEFIPWVSAQQFLFKYIHPERVQGVAE